MSTKQIHDRAVLATIAYMERLGHTEVMEADHRLTADVMSIDGTEVVATVVKVVKGGTTAEPKVAKTTLAKIRRELAQVEDDCRALGETVTGTRVDLVTILVLGPERALLRHHRSI